MTFFGFLLKRPHFLGKSTAKSVRNRCLRSNLSNRKEPIMTRQAIALAAAALGYMGAYAGQALAQSNEIFFQQIEGGPIRPLTAAEKEKTSK